MTPPKSPPQQAVSVEQADRDAAADYIRHHDYPRSEDIRKGRCDNHAAVVAFARHRLSAAPPADGVLVPVEPTREMVDAGRNAADDKRWAWCGYGKREPGTGLDGMEFYVRDAYAAMLSAAPKAPTAPIGEDGVSAPGADGLKSIGHDLAMAAGNLVVATDGQEAIRAERIAVLNALKAWEKTLADRAQGEGEKAS